ncbi:MAG: DUF881 domain-containing protein [Fimbriimonadaceae bacterium]
MNPFQSRTVGNTWVISVSVMALVLGFLLSRTWITRENVVDRIGLLSSDQQARLREGSIDLAEELHKVQTEVAKLRDDKTKLENAMAERSEEGKVLNDSLQEVKVLAGLTEVEGPGLTVTLRDSKRLDEGVSMNDKIIHDQDVLKVVNELYAAGAEAISVNGIRVVSGTSFKCVGNTILVDGVRIATPVVVQAIGDADTLEGGLLIPLGVVAEIRSVDPAMVSLSKVQKMRLPAYRGSTTRRFLTVPASES